jgi:hypothetical protein
VGLPENRSRAQSIKEKKERISWTASGRDEGVTRLLFEFDDSPQAHGHGKILGSDMVGTRAGHRQDNPPAPHDGRKHRDGGGGGAW